MKKTTVFLWSLVLFILLSACNSQDKQSLVIPSDTTKLPTMVVVPTQTIVEPTLTSRPTETATATPSYQVKQVLLDYIEGGYHTVDEMYYVDYGMDGWSKLVLYKDGQLIIPGTPYQQKILSKDDTDQLLSKLESLGFYNIESNQQHDPSDKLYNFGDQYHGVSDPMWCCVLINKDEFRKLCEWEPYKKFLVPEMKDILEYLDAYRVKGATPYFPDRILLWVQAGRNPNVESLAEKAIPWDDKFSSLETSGEKVLYFEGEEAKNISALFGNTETAKVFTQNGIEYTVSIDIVLPHEQLVLP